MIIMIYSEERTSSTHALTMYRHNTVVDGKEYKVGKYSSSISYRDP